jgi:hypothetical protein
MAKKKKKTGLLGKSSQLSFGQLFVFTILFAIVGGYATWTSFAASAKPSGTLVMNSASTVSYGDTVSFTGSYSGVKRSNSVKIGITCNIGNKLYVGDYVDLTTSPQTVTFTIGKPLHSNWDAWTSGSATCTTEFYTIGPSGQNSLVDLAPYTTFQVIR